MAGTLLPIPIFVAWNNNGTLSPGAIATFYLAGTTTLTSIFADVSLNPANQLANPLTADGNGRFPEIYVTPGQSYKMKLTDANGVPIDGYPADNIPSVPASSANLDVTGTAGETLSAGIVVYLSDGSGGKTAGLWYKADSANTYSSTTTEIGMTTAAIATGASGTMRQGGTVTGLTTVVGTLYYVGTAGAFTSTAPSNRRFIGQADTTSSIVMSANPPVSGLTVPQGGTGVATFTAHGVLIGEGTGAIVATATGTAGQVLVSGGSSADPSFGAGTFSLLHSGSGTDTNAGAADVDSFALTGLTALDTIYVVFLIESVTQQTANVILRTATDSISLGSLTNGGVIAAGVQVLGELLIKPRQGSTVNLTSRISAMSTTPTDMTNINAITVTTAWTGSWSLAMRHAGVTAGGTFKYVWNVFCQHGQ